jgi:Icc-related predicted phosphoesterase
LLHDAFPDVASLRLMRLRICSDLHFEFMRDGGRSLSAELVADPAFDVLVVAGDICSLHDLYSSLVTISEAARDKPVVYVLGNHEAYGGTLDAAIREARRAASSCSNLNLLEQQVACIQGQRFVGCTLWFPHQGAPEPLDQCLGDFSYIRDIYDWIAETAEQSARFLREQIRPGDVVVTHHLPHPKSIHPMYDNSPLNAFFLHDLGELVEHAGAALWVHGHTHSSCDYTVGKTRVVCNPFGYIRSSSGGPNPEFNGALTIDLSG